VGQPAEPPEDALAGVEMSVVRFRAGGVARLPAPADRAVFFYVVSGRVAVGETPVEHWKLVEFANDGDEIQISAISDAVILYGHADAIGEPVFSHGPFVMNTREEIIQAIEDYNAGKFGEVRL